MGDEPRNLQDYYWVYITNPSREEALKLARILVAEKLIACANLFDGVTSVYEWKGQVEESTETILVAKTPARLFEALKNRVAELHSYECPCVVALPIEAANSGYLDWIESVTRGD